MKLFSDAGLKWAGTDHGRWEPESDIRADRRAAAIEDWTEQAMSDPGSVSDFFANGFEVPAVAAQMMVDIHKLTVESRANLAMFIYDALERAAIEQASIAADLEDM